MLFPGSPIEEWVMSTSPVENWKALIGEKKMWAGELFMSIRSNKYPIQLGRVHLSEHHFFICKMEESIITAS